LLQAALEDVQLRFAHRPFVTCNKKHLLYFRDCRIEAAR
jgi:hypothetical protein